MFKQSKDVVKGLKQVRDNLMQLAFDYNQLGKMDKIHLSGQLTNSEIKLLALLTTIGHMLNEDANAPEIGMIKIQKETVKKKSWLWGLIKKEEVRYDGPPITMTVHDFMKRNKEGTLWDQ